MSFLQHFLLKKFTSCFRPRRSGIEHNLRKVSELSQNFYAEAFPKSTEQGWRSPSQITWGEEPLSTFSPLLCPLSCHAQRHPREIDNSLAIVCMPAAAAIQAKALNLGANQNTGPAFSAKVCFMAIGNITTTVNKGRQAWPGLFL